MTSQWELVVEMGIKLLLKDPPETAHPTKFSMANKPQWDEMNALSKWSENGKENQSEIRREEIEGEA